MTIYLRGLLEMQGDRKYCGVCDAELDTRGRCHSGHNYNDNLTIELVDLRAAVRTFAEHQTAENFVAMARLVRGSIIEPRTAFEWCDCEGERDADSGFCMNCADGK